MVVSYGVEYREAGNEYIVTNPTFGDRKDIPEEDVSVQSMRLTFAALDEDSDSGEGKGPTFENRSAEDEEVTSL